MTVGGDVPELHVAQGDDGRAAVEPYGRHSVIVAPRLLAWVYRGEISQTVAAAVVAQAAATLRVGPSRFDLSVRLLTAPGDLAVAGFSRIARLFTWLPGVLALWRIRAVFGVVAVCQCLQAQQVTIAITTAVLVAVSYTGQASARAWRSRVEADADRLVAEAGLADHLEFAVRSAGGPGSLNRAQRIRRASHDTRYEAPAPARRLYIVR